MNNLERLKNFFTAQSKGYKNYIEEMNNTPSEQWLQNGKRIFTDKEKDYERIFTLKQARNHRLLSDKIHNYKNKPVQEFTKEKIVILEPLESEKVKVIPATKEQKEQYSRHIDGEQLESVPYKIEGFTLTDYEKGLILVDELEQSPYGIQYEIDSDNYLKSNFLTVGKDENDIGRETKFITKEDVQFNKEENDIFLEPLELDDVKNQEFNPDEFRNEYFLDKDMYYELSSTHYYQREQKADTEMWQEMYEVKDKNDIIADTEEYKIAVSAISLEYPEILKKIEKGGKEDELIIDFQEKFIDTLQKLGMTNYENVLESHFNDVVSDRFNVLKAGEKDIVPLLDVYLVDKNGHVYFETVKQPLEVGDKINLLTKSGDLYAKGKVLSIAKEKMVITTSKGIVTAPFDARIEPLFLIDNQNKKTNIEFGVNETITLLTQKRLGLHDNYFEHRMNDFTDLLKGYKTTILPFVDLNKQLLEGKLHILNNFKKPFVSLEIKKPILDVEKDFNSGHDIFKLNQAQRNHLSKTGELGLVTLTSIITNKKYKRWVSVDKELNLIVTKREKDINIDNIFGKVTSPEQKEKFKAGEGVLLDIKGTNYFIIASASSKNSDGFRTFTESKAREFKLLVSNDPEKIKKEKSTSLKFN